MNTLEDILGVRLSAPPQKIRQAYRQRLLKLHPDLGGSAAEVKRLIAAYKTYCDQVTVIATNPSALSHANWPQRFVQQIWHPLWSRTGMIVLWLVIVIVLFLCVDLRIEHLLRLLPQ
jgi:hypothetical protein